MKNILDTIRNKLITVLAGKSTIIINANIISSEKLLIKYVKPNTLIINNKFQSYKKLN